MTTVTVIAVGNCTLRASQAGNASFLRGDRCRSAVFTVTRSRTDHRFLTEQRPRPRIVAPIELVAGSTSGLPVTFASLTPDVCRVNDHWLTTLTVGTCTIRASQAGNGNYAAAPNVDQSFHGDAGFSDVVVSPADGTIAAAPPVPATSHCIVGIGGDVLVVNADHLYNQWRCCDPCRSGRLHASRDAVRRHQLRVGVGRPEFHSNELRSRESQRRDSSARSSRTPPFWGALQRMATGETKHLTSSSPRTAAPMSAARLPIHIFPASIRRRSRTVAWTCYMSPR